MLQRLSSTRLLVDKRSVSDGGNAMPDKCNSCKHDVNGPKNLLRRTNPVSLLVENERYVSTGNGCCITADIFANCAPVTESPTRHTRSGCSSAAMMLYSSLGLMRAAYCIKIGMTGQIPRYFLTGVPSLQRSRRLRRRGDANMTCHHLWHTYVPFPDVTKGLVFTLRLPTEIIYISSKTLSVSTPAVAAFSFPGPIESALTAVAIGMPEAIPCIVPLVCALEFSASRRTLHQELRRVLAQNSIDAGCISTVYPIYRRSPV